MENASQDIRKRITAAFIKELEAFRRGGYRFNASGRALFDGTQREALTAYLEGIKDGHLNGYFEIPTGVGKTALFIAIIGCYLRATQDIQDAPRILIHEPTNDLVQQTALSFAEFMPDIAKDMEADDDQGRRIDWNNSQIDIHNTGRRGAKNNPKVLITTYQGQASDERKAPDKRLHRPANFGLIIHDEAHYLNGAKYGPAAVDKFRGSIQLGVTATPEYSEDKTVANKLGHRYYHLPLNTAIERGDLCHVRPIVLKTHLKGKDKIDMHKAREFLAQQQGLPLSKRQLEQLLNQEARNRAIIKAYLTGSHPDTGERFLGQTGMIFAGGITHCNDFILHAERVLNQPAYRNIKEWLRDEGVALIAPIHSQVPKDGIEIIIGGERRKCTKEAIKDLHRQGKVLLIISDQELKLGSDFPMDSFIADAVDRFSVPDATQRMGRGFRVDRGNERYGLAANPDKSCAAINVIDETTHEMYKDTPHHPIHAVEILHGAEHRPPGRRKGSLTRFKEHPPEVSEGMEALGFEFITKTEAMQAISKTFDVNAKQRLPVKTDKWWSKNDMRVQPGGGSARTKQAIAKLISGFEVGEGIPQKDGSVAMRYDGHVIHVQRMRVCSTRPLCFLGQNVVNAGLVQENPLPPKTDEWWSATEVRHKPRGNTARTRNALACLLTAFDERRGDQQENGCLVGQYDGCGIRMQQMRDAGGKNLICFVGQDLVNAGLVRETALPPKTDDWWSAAEVRHRHGGGTARTQRALGQLTRAFDEGNGEQKQDGSVVIQYEGVGIRVQQRDVGGKHPLCFFGQDLVNAGLVRENTLPTKTDEWWSVNDISKRPGGNSQSAKDTIRSLTRAFTSGEGTRQADGSAVIEHKGHRYHVNEMAAGTFPSVCVYGQDVIEAGVLAPDREKLRARAPGKKDISPNSDKLKRTGRSRATLDE